MGHSKSQCYTYLTSYSTSLNYILCAVFILKVKTPKPDQNWTRSSLSKGNNKWSKLLHPKPAEDRQESAYMAQNTGGARSRLTQPILTLYRKAELLGNHRSTLLQFKSGRWPKPNLKISPCLPRHCRQGRVMAVLKDFRVI